MNGQGHAEKWNRRHHEAADSGRVAQVLLRNRHLLPEGGKALDLACGRGANAMFLARSGLETHAWDFSAVAIERLDEEARKNELEIQTQVRDVLVRPPQPDSFDLVLVSCFLERRLVPRLMRALRPGGMIFYQTFVRDVYLHRGPSTEEWRLAPNELLHLFQGLQVRYYREDGKIFSAPTELSDLAMIVASRRS
ncbi:class I SAM-dependent methyltransferase [Thiolapillus sp.]